MKTITSKPTIVIIMILFSALILTACGQKSELGEGTLPPLPGTSTPIAHATPTPFPQRVMAEPAVVNWHQTAHFAPAMRADYVDDIAPFVEGNRYYIEATVELGEVAAVVSGVEQVRYVNRSPNSLNEIVFRLYPNLPLLGGSLRITAVTADGQAIDFVIENRETSLIVPLTQPLAPGETVHLVVEFIMTAERGFTASFGRFEFRQDLLVATGWYPVLSVYDEENGWWQDRSTISAIDPVFSETALYEVVLTHADNVHLAISGVSIETIENGDGTVSERFVSGPMRDSLLVASSVLGKITQVVDDTTVNVYYLPGDERGAEWALEVSVKALQAFNHLFGDYPFAELDVVETYNPTGVEYPGIVIISNQNWTAGNQTMEITVAHEVAHQWWYSLIHNDTVNHTWIDESLTSYSEMLYFRTAYDDNEERANERIENMRSLYNFFRGTPGTIDFPLDMPSQQYPVNSAGIIFYVKGRVLYDELERLLGREAFVQALRGYYEAHKYGITESIDVVEAFEAVIGEELDAFFYEWLGDYEGLDPDVKAEVDAQRSRQSS